MPRILALLSLLLLASFASLGQSTDISGAWIFHVTTDGGNGDPEFTLKQDAGKVTGRYKGLLGEADVKGTVEGNNLTLEFVVSLNGNVTVVYKGATESPERMKGTVDFGGQAAGTWIAEKKK